jgi:hypothetical protein
MDAVLTAVTALSLAMAVVMSVIAARLLRAERERSDARVAALHALSVEPVRAPRPAPPAALPRVAARPPRIDDLELRPAQRTSVRSAELFADTERPSAWGPRLAVIGTLAALIAVLGFVFHSTGSRPAGSAPQAAATAQSAAAAVAPLELVSLRHSQDAQNLTITGLVRNPRAGAPLSHAIATAFVFGSDGAFLASSRAPLDFTTVAPGDESTFVVSVPVTGDVSRYRIGFRAEDGRVIAHVDKRGPDALASTTPR